MTPPNTPSQEKRDQQRLLEAFSRLDRHALGLGCGVFAALAIFLMTAAMTLKGPVPCMACLDSTGGLHRGPHLELLAFFLPGYSVGIAGAFVGLLWGLVLGYAGGFLLATILNLHHSIYLRVIERRFRHEGLTNV